MLRTSRHNHKVSSFDILIFSSNGGFADTRSESQGLVDGVNLQETAVSQSVNLWSRTGVRNSERTSSPMSPPTGTVMSTTCEYNPVQSTLRNSPDLDGNAEVMSGKYAISCLGGPEGILGSLAQRIADWVKAFLVDAEGICLEEYLRMVRGRAILIIVTRTIGEVKLLGMMKCMPRYDVFDRIHSSFLGSVYQHLIHRPKVH